MDSEDVVLWGVRGLVLSLLFRRLFYEGEGGHFVCQSLQDG